MNEELFGEIHEQEEYGLFGKEHERQQCFLHSVTHRFSVGDKVNYCNGLIFEIASINENAEVCYDKKGMWYALVNCKPA